MQKQLLDENNIQLGILNPTGDNGASFQNREFGNGVASAMNRWVEAEWLIEPRLKGSIVVPYEDADAAVAEIERWAGDPRFVQVLMVTRTANPPGQKQYWKIYEAAAAANLPIGVHAFGFGGYPVTGSGWPSFYIEDMVGHAQSSQSFLTSLVIEGVFERIPNFKLVLIESGFAWLPPLAWRLDKLWHRLKQETPHLKRAPSEYIREQRLADHPADGGAAAARARAGCDRLDRLGPAAVRHRLPALGLRRPDPGAADAAARAAAPRLLLQQRDEAVPAGLSTLPDQPDFDTDHRARLHPDAVGGQSRQPLSLPAQGRRGRPATSRMAWSDAIIAPAAMAKSHPVDHGYRQGEQDAGRYASVGAIRVKSAHHLGKVHAANDCRVRDGCSAASRPCSSSR